jgi:hypothetical protein
MRNAVPGAVQKRLPGVEPQARPTFRSDAPAGYADPLDGFAVRGFPGLVCNEQAFHYLLAIERRRSENTRRPFLLMLIEGDALAAGILGGGAHWLERLFPIVCNAVRETDFVGWYRHGAVVGVTFTQDGRPATTHGSGIVRDRIVEAFHSQLPSHLVPQLRLRLYEVLGNDDLLTD